MPSPHLVALWNPSYAADALDMHAQLLLEHVRRADEGDAEWDDAYVWWGRVRSPNRQQPLEHLPQVLALNNGLDARDELQLYLTDYRSLYVAEVIAVEEGDKKTTDAAHTPEYYRRDGLSCDCWFKLADIRALVHDDTLAVQEELRQLRVITYNDRPVSLYGGMVNLPLLVKRPDGTRFFDEDERDLLNAGALWVAADAERLRLNLKLTTLNLALPAAKPEWRTAQPGELFRLLDGYEMRSTAAEARRRHGAAEPTSVPIPPPRVIEQQTELF